jgi:hypothetical protein
MAGLQTAEPNSDAPTAAKIKKAPVIVQKANCDSNFLEPATSCDSLVTLSPLYSLREFSHDRFKNTHGKLIWQRELRILFPVLAALAGFTIPKLE